MPQILHPEGTTRRAAALTLGGIGPKAKAAVGDLARLARDADPSVRISAALATVQVRPDDRLALRRLEAEITRLLYRPTPASLAQLDRGKQARLDLFLGRLASADFAVGPVREKWSVTARLYLSRLGPEAIPSLVRTLSRVDRQARRVEVRRVTTVTLEKADPKKVGLWEM